MYKPWLLFCATLVGACNDPTYLPQTRPLETQATMDGTGSTVMVDGDLFVLPVRKPSSAERQALTKEQQTLGLMQAVPWVGVRDVDLEVSWSVKNLEGRAVQAFVSIDGGNEFGDFIPELYVVANDPEQQTPPPALLGGSPINLAANQVVAGTFREDELVEAALDLEAIVRYPDAEVVRNTPYEVLSNRSSVSRVGLEQIPAKDVIPAMVRFQLHLTASGHVALDYSVRVRDYSKRLAAPGTSARNLYVSTVSTLPPAAANLPAP